MNFRDMEDSNYDPFKLQFQHLYEHILDYLDGNDILQLSSVSKFMYMFIAQSKKAMEKIKFVISEKHGRTLDAEMIENSERGYQYIVIKGIFSPITNLVGEFLKKNYTTINRIISCYDIPLNEGFLPNIEYLTFYSANMENSHHM